MGKGENRAISIGKVKIIRHHGEIMRQNIKAKIMASASSSSNIARAWAIWQISAQDKRAGVSDQRRAAAGGVWRTAGGQLGININSWHGGS